MSDDEQEAFIELVLGLAREINAADPDTLQPAAMAVSGIMLTLAGSLHHCIADGNLGPLQSLHHWVAKWVAKQKDGNGVTFGQRAAERN